MSMKEQEAKMVEEIDARNLKRIVLHHIKDAVYNGRQGTSVILFDKEDWFKHKSEDRLTKAKRVATGRAEVSDKDQFNRKLGRMIATGRALKNIPE